MGKLSSIQFCKKILFGSLEPLESPSFRSCILYAVFTKNYLDDPAFHHHDSYDNLFFLNCNIYNIIMFV